MTELGAAAPPIADIIILAVMGVSLVFGLFRGLLRELLSLVSWILAFWIAYRYSASVAQIIDKALQNPTLSQAVSAVFVFVLVLVALMLLASLISTVPLLKPFDPLPIVAKRSDEEDVEEDRTDITDPDAGNSRRVEKMFDQDDADS